MPAPKNNKNSVKEKKRDNNVVIRCFYDEKEKWVDAANRKKETMSEWARDRLNGGLENGK